MGLAHTKVSLATRPSRADEHERSMGGPTWYPLLCWEACITDTSVVQSDRRDHPLRSLLRPLAAQSIVCGLDAASCVCRAGLSYRQPRPCLPSALQSPEMSSLTMSVPAQSADGVFPGDRPLSRVVGASRMCWHSAEQGNARRCRKHTHRPGRYCSRTPNGWAWACR